MRTDRLLSLCLAAALAAGCDRESTSSGPEKGSTSPAVTNRVDIPANVRQNLGITFAKVERRAVTRTLRLPGAFELLPSASREVRAPTGGRVELLVNQFEKVSVGQPICRIDSDGLRSLQRQLAEANAAVSLAEAASKSIPPLFDAHEKHHQEIERSVALWTERVTQLSELRSAGGGQAGDLATANASLAQARADFAETLEKEAELTARKSETDARLVSARQTLDLLWSAMSALTAEPRERLLANNDVGVPAWQSLSAIEIKAGVDGVVSAFDITNGAYVDANAALLTVIAPNRLRFRATGYQSDLWRLSNGLDARVVAPAGRASSDSQSMSGLLVIAPQASPATRTIDLFVTPGSVEPWALAGVSGFVEITLAGSDAPELAIPMACVVQDGLTPVLFRRDPRDPDKVIRLEADVGPNDGRWVVIRSGVAEGNEIVQDGVYQLLVATSGSIQKGGHFHPDGTFHEGED